MRPSIWRASAPCCCQSVLCSASLGRPRHAQVRCGSSLYLLKAVGRVLGVGAEARDVAGVGALPPLAGRRDGRGGAAPGAGLGVTAGEALVAASGGGQGGNKLVWHMLRGTSGIKRASAAAGAGRPPSQQSRAVHQRAGVPQDCRLRRPARHCGCYGRSCTACCPWSSRAPLHACPTYQ